MLIGAGGLGLGGCAAANPSTEGGLVVGSRFEVVETKVGASAVRAADISLDVAGLLRYITIGDDSTARLIVERGSTRPEWTVTRRESKGDGDEPKLVSEQRLVLLADGSVAIAEEIVHDEGVEVVFEPPMVVMPTELREGGPFVQQLKMTVHPLGNRKRTKASGEVESTIELVGDEQLETEAGRLETRHVRHIFVAKLKPAEVSNTTDQWYMDRIGRVAERRREQTKVMGIQIRSNQEDWVIERMPG